MNRTKRWASAGMLFVLTAGLAWGGEAMPSSPARAPGDADRVGTASESGAPISIGGRLEPFVDL